MNSRLLPGVVPLMLTLTAAAQNLIVNGDFEQGNTGFGSQYLFSTNLSPAETYAILDNPRSGNGLFAEIGDHTTGDGLMMVINGSTRDDAPVAWSQEVAVAPDTDHAFSFWAANLFGQSPSRLRVRINGTDLEPPVSIAPELGAWNPHELVWNSGDAETARIEIVFLSAAFGGNDTALDDIVFSAEAPPCLVGLTDPTQFEELHADLVVPGNANPFLAGQPDGAATKSDRAPAESPVFATEVAGGDILSFAVEGSVAFNELPEPTSPPDGVNAGFGSSASALGIAGYTGLPIPTDALMGVFLTDGVPADPPPDELTYPDGLGFTVLAPEVRQVFFIGDGLTGNGAGQRQEFVVPPGATRLFLGTSDAFGWFNNTGEFEVSICRLRNLDPSSELQPTTIRFDRPEYEADLGVPVNGTIEIDPLPRGGLYSQGMAVTLRNEEGTLAGLVTPTPAAALDFDGPRIGEAGATSAETGVGGIKGSALFSTALTTHTDPVLASFSLTDLPPGEYDLAIQPWNELGPTEDIFVTADCRTLDDFITFGTARVEIVGSLLPEITLSGPIELQRQTGLLEQRLTLTNHTGRVLEGFRLFITGLPEGVVLWNAHGEIDGVPYIDIAGGLAPGESMEIVLEYYRPSRVANFTPTFELAPPAGTLPVAGQRPLLGLDLRVLRKTGEGLLIEFLSEKDKRYRFEYSDDMGEWKVSPPVIIGTGERIQWLDAGPPRTDRFPAGSRFYRVTEEPDAD